MNPASGHKACVVRASAGKACLGKGRVVTGDSPAQPKPEGRFLERITITHT